MILLDQHTTQEILPAHVFSSIEPCIVYLRTDSENISNDSIRSLETESEYKYAICDTMSTFLSRITSVTEVYPSLILIDHQILTKNNVSVDEMVSMITTVVSYMDRPKTKTLFGVVIDKSCSKEFLKNLQKTDISGIVPKTNSLGYDIMSSSLKALLKDEYYWPKSMMDLLTGQEIIAAKKCIKLTPRQSEILALVCNRGLSNKKIAGILKISESTVKVHVSVILKIYGVRNRTQLVLAVNDALKAKSP